jgi:hypothetical protein
MDVSLDAIQRIISNGGVVGLFILFFVAVQKEWFVPGAQYKDLKQDRDDWKEIALTGTNAAERAIGLAERRRRDAGR